MFSRRLFPSCKILSKTLLCARRSVISEDPEERERERELRARVLQRYRGMNIPEFTDFRYGQFAPEKGMGTAVASQAYGAARNGFPPGGDTTSKNGIDWLMLFTGLGLVFASSKLMMQRFSTGSLDAANVPLWIGSLETQAKYMLFLVQFDADARENIKREYIRVRQSNPFLSFFQWLRTGHPEYGQGTLFHHDAAVNTLVAILSSDNSRSMITLAHSLQSALRRRGGSPESRIDEFLTQLGGVPGATGVGGNSLIVGPSSFSPPLPPLQMHGTEQLSIESALETAPSEQHSSVPFQ